MQRGLASRLLNVENTSKIAGHQSVLRWWAVRFAVLSISLPSRFILLGLGMCREEIPDDFRG